MMLAKVNRRLIHIKSLRIVFFCMIILSCMRIQAQSWNTAPSQQEELGLVHWLRSYDEAIQKGKQTGKPIFILFQEVPGCSTCKNYGNNLLTHPHIVEALESHFVPLAIFNNKGGSDAAILRKFGEPSWNNPVARIIDPNSEKDIVKRLNGRYDMESLISTISNGLLESNQLIPDYLTYLQEEYQSSDPRETHLSMYCFWSGEKNLGKLDGVLATKAGFMNGAEVVKVKYDANRLKEKELISFAASKQCADGVFSDDQREIQAAKKLKVRTKSEGKFRADRQPKYYMYNSDYRYVPMTSLQALKVNSDLSNKTSPDRHLSPRQLEILELVRQKKISPKSVIDENFPLTWNNLILQ